MKRVWAGLAMVLAVAAFGARAEPFKVAVTVDDLPAHGGPTPGMTRSDVARAYLAPLKAHKVPGVYGFINANSVEGDADKEQALKLWREAGYPLGNHGFTHMNANTGLAAFEGDIEKNEPILAQLMAGEDWPNDWHVLRFPFLSAGADPALHKGIMDYLTAHGYRIADVSISFNDWAYTDTYNRCLAKGDTATIDTMKTQYMRGVKASIAHSLYGSQKLYGRQISHVLLIHEGAFTALMLPQVLDEFEAEGATFVTLDEAQSDPVYGAPSAHQGEGLIIERQAKEKGVDIWQGAPADVDISNLSKLCS